ncbi:MAG: hypothetical protein ACI4EO_07725 [Blautia sp.]
MRRNSFTQPKCRKCGKRINFIQTTAGKQMPCDPGLVMYKSDGGKDRIVLPSGKVVSGTIINGTDDREADGYGYISHFATCEYAQMFRRK